MVDVLARNWSWVALRGVAALLFGIITLPNPVITLAVLVLFFGGWHVDDRQPAGCGLSRRQL